jgi:hypothetical protein
MGEGASRPALIPHSPPPPTYNSFPHLLDGGQLGGLRQRVADRQLAGHVTHQAQVQQHGVVHDLFWWLGGWVVGLGGSLGFLRQARGAHGGARAVARDATMPANRHDWLEQPSQPPTVTTAVPAAGRTAGRRDQPPTTAPVAPPAAQPPAAAPPPPPPPPPPAVAAAAAGQRLGAPHY